jgi:Lanthionine synthetase C-like protein/HopA1 effector protein family
MKSNATLIDALAQHVQVSSDLTGFGWFGMYHPVFSEVGADLTTAERRKCLVDSMADCLYGNFYCTGKPTPKSEHPPYYGRGRHTRFVRKILNANRTRIAWCEMKILRVIPSYMVCSYGGIATYVNTASPLLRYDDNPRLQEDGFRGKPDKVIVGGRSWSLNASPGFIFMSGEREPGVTSRIQRLYWNLNAFGASGLVDSVTMHLNRYRVPFKLKVLADPVLYNRRVDTAVLYLDLRVEKAVEAVWQVHQAIADQLRIETPAMTHRIAPGVAFAHDPRQGVSFGVHRCRLIAESFVRAAEAEMTAAGEVLSFAEEAFGEQGVNLDSPHKLVTDDDSEMRQLEAAVHQSHPRTPANTERQIESSSEKSWLATAEDAGSRLVSEAFWFKDQCQWIGGEVIGISNRFVFRNLTSNIYKGTAGIGHCLAELAVRTQNERMGATARGAIRHSLGSARTDGPCGLYVGALGVAIVAIRAARTLGDEQLEDEATAFALRLRAMIPEESSDLLSGVAGQILGLLILAEYLSEPALNDKAFEFGEQLLLRACHQQTGWSWANAMIESSCDLTGLSHGTAGVAFALVALGRATGTLKFLSAAREAIAYEDAAFSEQHSNWPDYRSAGLGRVKYSSYWCHGAPGVILSRLQLRQCIGDGGFEQKLFAAGEAFQQFVATNLHQRDANFCLCHGVAGNAEILCEMSRCDSFPETWRTRAAATANECWRFGATFHSPLNSWPCGAALDNPSLLIGRAGIAYAYLRLHDPSAPSVLAIDPAKWSDKQSDNTR